MRWIFLLFLPISLLAGEVRTIVFDYRGVVARTDKTQVASWISDTFAFSKDELDKALSKLKESESRFGFWEKEFNELGVEIPQDFKDHFRRQATESLEEHPGMFALVFKLKELGYETVLFSNGSEEIAAIVESKGHLVPFDPAVFSYQLGAKKPNRKAFDGFLEIVGRTPEECLFIDDKKENVVVARALGFDAIHFKNFKQLKKELKKRDIL